MKGSPDVTTTADPGSRGGKEGSGNTEDVFPKSDCHTSCYCMKVKSPQKDKTFLPLKNE